MQYRMVAALEFVADKGYLTQWGYQPFRREQRKAQYLKNQKKPEENKSN